MKRKLLAILLTMAMVITMIPAIFVTVTAEAAFVPQPDAWFEENGYTAITDAAGLKAATMGTAPDAIAKYYLKNDIVVPDGTTTALMGELVYIELDGNGHTISNVQAVNTATEGWLKLAGLSNRVYGYTTVKNLNMTGSVTSTVATKNAIEMGGVFGTINGAYVLIDNVHANMTVTGGTNCIIGGLIGYVSNTGETGMNKTGTEQTGTDVTVKNSSFSGTVTAGGNQVGGFIGRTNGKKFTMIDCASYATVNVTGGTAEPWVGGVMGQAYATEAVSLTRVVRNGNIVETNKSEGVGTGWARVGGFIGVATSAAFDLDIVDCKSYGTLTGTNDVAGYVGVWYTNDEADKTTFVGCENYSTTTVGGFAGFVAYPNGSPVYLKDCANYANIISNGQVSGFIRNCKTTATLEGCVNYGTIESTSHNDVGGFVASVPAGSAGKLTLTKCVNFGTIQTHRTTGWQRLSGFVGNVCDTGDKTLTCLNIELNYCANFGHIYGASKVGTPCYGDMVGGFKAQNCGNTVVLNNCYGAGNITVHEENALGNVHAMVGATANGLTVNNCVSAYKLVPGSALTAVETGCTAIDENSDLAAIVAALNTGLAAGSEAFVLDDGQIEPVYALNKVATQVYATQEAKDGAAGTVDVRVLALVNSLGYDKAGVNIYKVGNNTPVKTATTTTVYSGVINGEDTLYAPYGTYYLPITVKGINAEGTYTFVVETFVEKGEDVTPSDTYTIVVTDGEVVSAKKN